MKPALLVLVLAASPGLAQQPVPSGLMRPALAPPQALHGHPYLDRSEYLLKRTVAAGAIIGGLAGALQPHPESLPHGDKVLLGAIVGSAFGALTGAAAAGVTNFVPPSPRNRFEHLPVLRTRDLSRYFGFGAQVGTSFGVLFAMQEGAGKSDDDADTFRNQMILVGSGLVTGFVVGGLLYFLQH